MKKFKKLEEIAIDVNGACYVDLEVFFNKYIVEKHPQSTYHNFKDEVMKRVDPMGLPCFNKGDKVPAFKKGVPLNYFSYDVLIPISVLSNMLISNEGEKVFLLNGIAFVVLNNNMLLFPVRLNTTKEYDLKTVVDSMIIKGELVFIADYVYGEGLTTELMFEPILLTTGGFHKATEQWANEQRRRDKKS